MAGGYLLYSGATDYAVINRSVKAGSAKSDPVVTPSRVKGFDGQPLDLVASGSAAAHGVIVDAKGTAYVFGRNEAGQCGVTPCDQISTPTKVSSPLLKDKKVTAAACGKHHTVLVTEDGLAFAFGSNKMGQCGVGGKVDTPKNQKAGADTEKPIECKQCEVSDVVRVACGAEFTLFVTKDGALYACGNPQYGQLGIGTDGQYNSSGSSIKMVFQPYPKPTRVGGFNGEKVVNVAAGQNHAIATTDAGHAYTWGFGGYGRLGHKEQKDEMVPRRIELFTNRFVLPDNGASSVIACGQTFTLITAMGGQMYVFGKPKATGDNIMYPKPLMDLSGWSIRSLSCGSTNSLVCSEDSTIAWGSSSYGECGFGEGGPKSSANPKKVDALEGRVANMCAAGTGLMMVLMKDPVDSFPLYEPPNDAPAPAKAGAGGAKRKAPAKAPKQTKKQK